MQILSPAEFEELVVAALDGLPPEMARNFRNVAVVVEDEHPDDPDLLGLYEGVPLTERDVYSGVLPDRISVYRIPSIRSWNVAATAPSCTSVGWLGGSLIGTRQSADAK